MSSTSTPDARQPALPGPSRSALALGVLLPLVVTALGATVAVVAAARMELAAIGPLGFVDALPAGYYVGAALVVFAFVWSISRVELVRPVLVAEIVTLAMVLFGLAPFVEDVTRLPTTWVHVGLIDYIERNGEVLSNYDARFSWPGFFTTMAAFFQVAGIKDPQPFLSWAPLLFNLLNTTAVWAIARSAGASIRASWLAAWLFLLVNWEAQDYFSPQGYVFVMATAFLAVLLRVFSTSDASLPRWVNNLLGAVLRGTRPGRGFLSAASVPVSVNSAQSILLLVVLMLLYLAAVMSHQLTPVFLLILTTALVVFGRIRLMLPAIMAVFFFAWISYGAIEFWGGGLDSLFGDVGNVSNTLNQNVGARVQADPAHVPAVQSRLLLTVGMWFLCVVSLVWQLFRRQINFVCLLGFFCPFLILGGQAYGGEAMLRVYLFGLPAVVAAIAMMLAPEPRRGRVIRIIAVGLIGITMVPLFLLARHGNEAYERFDSSELALVEETYRMAPPGSILLSLNAYLPQKLEGIESYRGGQVLKPTDRDGVEAIDRAVEQSKRTAFLVVTRAQGSYGEIVEGRAPGWTRELVTRLVDTGRYRVVLENAGGWVVEAIEVAGKS